ncbi:MAG: hypothetical protein H7Y22_06785 [Gemmatimonadaceae bacterium]|nr:hypothetical protein [Gloeobacterales cyanobacterium ES-bin-141]
MTNTKPDRDPGLIYPGDLIPAFATEAEEAEWWDSHELSDEFLQTMKRKPDGLLPTPQDGERASRVPE